MKKVLFWDFDGTLVESQRWSRPVWQMLQDNGHEVPLETVRYFMSLPAAFTWHRPEESYTGRTGSIWWEGTFASFHQLYQSQNIPKERWAFLDEKAREYVIAPERYELYPDTVAVLKSTAQLGFEHYILSNNFPELWKLVETLGLAPYFSGHIVSALEGYEKPRKELFEIALERAGNPDTAVMIGDNPVADIQGAKEAGLSAILVHSERPEAAQTLSGIPQRLRQLVV